MFKKGENKKFKARIREEISRKRRYLTKKEKTELDKKIINSLISLPEWKKAKKVLIYIAHRYEVQTSGILEKFLDKKQIIVPKTHLRFHSLSLHKIKSPDDLFIGRYGLSEPSPGAQMIEPENIDLAVIPGMVFDLKGHRIGYGKGYYDKLNKHLNCKKISLAYSFQIIDNIPAEKHDQPVNILITEKKIYRFR
jgi:5-formyltetrahydrofolate cyclo-ligase